MKETQEFPKLMTTHCPPSKRPKFLARPIIINGRRALAYMNGNEIESYIPLEEAQEQIYRANLPEMTVGF